METYTFIQVIVVAAMITIVTIVLSVPVEAKFGVRAARRTLHASLAGFAATVAAALGVSRLTSEWSAFAQRQGWGILAEILAFFGTFIFIAYFMASRHLAYKAAAAEKERG